MPDEEHAFAISRYGKVMRDSDGTPYLYKSASDAVKSVGLGFASCITVHRVTITYDTEDSD